MCSLRSSILAEASVKNTKVNKQAPPPLCYKLYVLLFAVYFLSDLHCSVVLEAINKVDLLS